MVREYDLKMFQGPLDLLMHLIEKNKIDIFDIPIGLLTDQYMEYLEQVDAGSDMDYGSEFLVMASTLLYLKAKSLLPVEEEETEVEDPARELMYQLLEYKVFQEMREVLKEQEEDAGNLILRKEDLPDEVKHYKPPVDLDELLKGVDLKKLHLVFQAMMRRQRDRKDPVRSEFGRIQREPIKVGDRVTLISRRLLERNRFPFTEVLEEGDRYEIIVTFLAVLELMKAGLITIEQDEQFGEIQISKSEGTDSAGLSEAQIAELGEYE